MREYPHLGLVGKPSPVKTMLKKACQGSDSLWRACLGSPVGQRLLKAQISEVTIKQVNNGGAAVSALLTAVDSSIFFRRGKRRLFPAGVCPMVTIVQQLKERLHEDC
ncbi:unnamed protein product, partial [Chrysoparadoxa australica]